MYGLGAVFTFGLALMGGAAWAQAETRTPLRIETIESEPFGYKNATDSGGMMFEIGNLIADRAGLPYRNQVVPYARTVLSLRTGTADMVLRFANEELVQVAHQVAAVLELRTVVLTLQGAPYQKLDDMAGVRLSIARSFPFDEALNRVPGLRLEWVPNNDTAVKLLFAGRIDAAFGSEFGLIGAAQRLQLPTETLAAPIPVGRQSFWLHLSRRSATPELIERLKKACDSLQSDGSIERIYKRYQAQLSHKRSALP